MFQANDPKDVNMIVGYEAGRRLEETDREKVDFSRVEQFENWFLASAPANPVLLRTLEIIRQKFLWKVQKTIDFTGPGTFSDAVHEFLANCSEEHGIPVEVSRRTGKDTGMLSFPSESKHPFGSGLAIFLVALLVLNGLRPNFASRPNGRTASLRYQFGEWKAWLLASGRVASPGGYASGADPGEKVLEHRFFGTWKKVTALIATTDFVLVSK